MSCSRWLLGYACCLAGLHTLGCSFDSEQPSIRQSAQRLEAWSQSPPGLEASNVPQFVALSFDDNNFYYDGMSWAVQAFDGRVNPAGRAQSRSFDGEAVKTTFFNTTQGTHGQSVPAVWRAALDAGHEIANHTEDHDDGGSFSFEQWQSQVETATLALTDPDGLGLAADALVGFRTPYLAYDDALFDVLEQAGFTYDSSIQNCWAELEDGTNCSWPHGFDTGSPDADELTARFNEPPLSPHPGLWEVPVTTLILPPDTLAAEYAFAAGLRARVAARAPFAGHSQFDEDTGKISGLDITLFYDAGMTPAEVLATLKYTFDLHYSGNRSPLVFVAHTHVYSTSWDQNVLSTAAERRAAMDAFLDYVSEHAEARMRPVQDIVQWMEQPVGLDGSAPAAEGTQGNGGSKGSPADSNLGGGSVEAGESDGVGDTVESQASGCSCQVAGIQRTGASRLPSWALLTGLMLLISRRRWWFKVA